MMSTSTRSPRNGCAGTDTGAVATADRLASLLAKDDNLARLLPDVQAAAEVQAASKHSISVVEGMCKLYADRAALAWRPATKGSERPEFTTLSYKALWQRIGRLATALAQQGLAAPGKIVGIWGHASPSWLVADLACLYNAAAAAALQTTLPIADLVHLAESDALHTIVCSTPQLPRMAELVARCDTVQTVVLMDEEVWPMRPELQDALRVVQARCTVTSVERLEAATGDGPWAPMRRPGEDGVPADTLIALLYTSGSTGLPKGAMFTDDLWRENFRQSFLGDVGAVPWVNYGYLPLNHLAGLGILFSVLSAGGISYFTAKPDMSDLFADLRQVRPTIMMLVPRVSSLIYQQFCTAVAKAGATDDAEARCSIMRKLRDTTLGDRLVMLLLATAPTSCEVQTFLRDCFEVPVFDTFGQTENGGLLFAGHVLRSYVTDYKLVDVPELGYATSDKPFPRGELLIKSKRMIRGYYNNPGATRDLFDEEGYMRTGDIMEERAPDVLQWVDRKRNILKLAQGEFVSLSRLESIYTDGSPLISQVFCYGKSSASYLLAVVCPAEAAAERSKAAGATDPAALKRLLMEDMGRVARQHGLAGWEIPRDILVFDGGFTKENGLLTESNKPARPHLKDRFGSLLDGLFDAIASKQHNATAALQANDLSGEPVLNKVLHTVGTVLGIDAPDAQASFSQLGGDSIAAVTLGELLEEVCGMTLSAGSILDPGATLASLAGKLESRSNGRCILAYKDLHPDAGGPCKADLRLERIIPADLLRPEKRAKTRLRRQINHVFLTGATGFLGRFLLLDLLKTAQKTGGHVTCLVRASNDRAAHARLAESMATRSLHNKEISEIAATFAALDTPQLLTVLAGDFAQADFGLPRDVYTRLSKNVDCVLHNGALVNHAYNYEQEFEPNVGGTVEVMRFALHGRRKILSYVSTVAVTSQVQRDDTLLEKENPGDWWPDFPPADTYAAGYGTSKWVCEVLLRQLHDVCGIPVNIFRPSMILGHSRAPGQINLADVFTRLMVSLIATRIAPPSFFVDDYQGPKRYDGLPVDFVATAIASLAVQSHGPVQSYNVVNPYPNDPSLDAMVQGIVNAGYPLRCIEDYDTWFAMFRDKLESLPGDIKQHSLLPLVDMWKHPQVLAPAKVGTAQLRRDVALMTPYRELPHLDETFLAQTLRHLRYHGLVPNPQEHAQTLPSQGPAQHDGVAT